MLLQLFKEYNNLPISKSLHNFAKVYNDVFVKELPNATNYYALNEFMICELTLAKKNHQSSTDQLRIPYKYSFAQHTSRWVDFSKSAAFLSKLSTLLRVTKVHDNEDEMLDLQKRGMRHEPFPGNAHMAGGQ